LPTSEYAKVVGIILSADRKNQSRIVSSGNGSVNDNERHTLSENVFVEMVKTAFAPRRHGDTEEIIEKNRILVISKKVKHNVTNI